MSLEHPAVEPVRRSSRGGDGRHRRALRTRRHLIRAYIELARERQQIPTAAEVAARGGLSLRSIFQRFSGLGELGVAAFDHVLDQPVVPPPVEVLQSDRTSRIAFHVGIRAQVCETWGPLWRVVQQARCIEVAARVDRLRGLFRDRIRLVFGRELAAVEPGQRLAILIALEALTDFECWSRMRSDHGLSFEDARRMWRDGIDRILPAAEAH